ncbi:carbamoyl-phosphate synthase (glutamine-hydrolyzing) large subunit [Weeksella virosa]|uniref:Carbamoyl phosphate synthase arginine-specific large chain n=1 Tax=Weeksella virosa (strain ATCC 43766 / DSM 16922 / JCM 21250 / CCUG 30538 / CDC 9751 / IAM 14551 / NBRC 16016 / NCTC 11634 / CL345/78) TaxID=865938 RepID=F0NY30_WEEVC|nr:carbamoyl-phosphate synthase (glutamine-hydrolyzing) large subunit [Weeksella virosa]ADX67021.1 carbamoyl-phosphate synthase, large subunit [Weeksella virosa DSM 16922]VEH63249.1 Carbamoyl-phosphate synthase large chain [Weeksella virosa]
MINDIKKVLVLGSGALKIGEAGEFDYSGSQALKALKEEGIKTILINPNIATVQTSEGIADEIYFLPITPYFVEKVIAKERPDGILVAFGGQTALNCAVELNKNKIFDRYNVRVLGTPISVIESTEDRDIFIEKLDQIGVLTARSEAVETVEDAMAAGKKIGFPLIIRAAYALGGLGSGFANNEEELYELVEKAFTYSNQVLVEESLKGWKEIEYEVVRDAADNCITVCNMENFDPIGVHTGESIVVAPSQTLTSSEYHKLREIAIRTIRHLGVVGECNIQYAFDPVSEEYRVIEVNARLSRSSALASKATGYPLAFVAAKLALGYTLDELKNSVTKTTSAMFEPALDYCVVKLPRWDLSKFYGVRRNIGSAMKSVGEVMAIGRSFEEAIQKGIRMLDIGHRGFVANSFSIPEGESLDTWLAEPNDERLYAITEAFKAGYSIEKIHDLTKIDLWFLQRLERIFRTAEKIEALERFEQLDKELLHTAKKQGFSDQQIGVLIKGDRMAHRNELTVRELRKNYGILPVVKQIDTLAAEFPAQTNYLYITYHGTENDLNPETEKSVCILGSGVYRIGSSVEFDWCGVNAAQTASKNGYKTIIINYNPETVSTDYDTSDRLYFEELTFERVMDILEFENPFGTIISTGGQIPNNLAMKLYDQNKNILGTSPLRIDDAENRHKFSEILDELGIDQPRWKELSSLEAVHSFVDEVGFPVLIRPSYVLSGAAMNIVSNSHELDAFLKLAKEVSPDYPVVVSEFVQGAKEIELDAVCQNGEIVDYAVSEHVEFAGVHSGDATMYYPPQKVYIETIRQMRKVAAKIAKRFEISGPMNIQFLSQNNTVRVIETNIRASRSFPFVSKVSGHNLIEKATKILLGIEVEKGKSEVVYDLDYVGVKASQFSFTRLQGADPVLSVDMSSTGEVGCIGDSAEEALLKSMLSVGYKIPEKTVLISGGPIESKVALLGPAKELIANGYKIYATEGTHKFFTDNDVYSTMVYWPSDEKEPNVITYMHDHKFDMVINIPKNLTKAELDNDYQIRRTAVDFNIPLITNARLASAFIHAFTTLSIDDLKIKTWREYQNK